jgi:outer membrane protein OmpA-like peptidoglycan-associated protein
VPPPPKFAEPTPSRPESPPRQIAKAVGPANGTAVDPTAMAPVGDQVRLAFASGANDLDDSARGKLDGVAHGLSQNPKLRLQLLAYAGGTSDAGSQARRLSLSRALSVRSYLIEKGVPSTRIDVRALGNKVEDGPPDRVDVVVTQR